MSAPHTAQFVSNATSRCTSSIWAQATGHGTPNAALWLHAARSEGSRVPATRVRACVLPHHRGRRPRTHLRQPRRPPTPGRGGSPVTGPGVPTRDDVDRLHDGDRHRRRDWWVLIWVGNRWRLVFDPPSRWTR